ncbi:hypothetical protein AJ79_09851 [Helicocarpus griseus UAMH5409]|uniref:Uncharacterized protein n=1 Tax=Helicocarpus griseus UAMH5409 TaxID=1447875 RepID=A0A2B7WGW7_9EURO|nr:hypothetical protein AJ79_09851 [Helicocarpus griseus UAMH5409]
MWTPLPILICGRTPEIATAVIELLKPEFEVIHVLLTTETAKSEIPIILRRDPNTTFIPCASNLGTKSYTNPPFAIVFGGGYTDQDVAEIEQACKNAGIEEISKQIPWIRNDLAKPAPPPGPEYGRAVAERAKECLMDLAGMEAAERGGIWWY